MATCKDCIHFEVCDSGRHIGEYIVDDGIYSDGVEKECPTFKNKADVAEVKHGKWIGQYPKVPKCSVCSAIDSMKGDYCRYCGAKMDGQ